MTSDGNVQANTEKVAAATDALVAKLVEYATENQLSMLDVFMVGHNLHKRVAMDAAMTWSKNGVSAKKVFEMADKTFRKSMKELRLG